MITQSSLSSTKSRLDPVSKDFPEIKEKDIFHDENDPDYAVNVLSLIRRKNFHEDSFVVLEIPGKAIRYKLQSGG